MTDLVHQTIDFGLRRVLAQRAQHLAQRLFRHLARPALVKERKGFLVFCETEWQSQSRVPSVESGNMVGVPAVADCRERGLAWCTCRCKAA